MHELSIATEIISIAEREMIDHHLGSLEEIGVVLGALSGVDPEALAFSFEAATKDTALANTRLHIERVAVEAHCRACNRDAEVEQFIFICPHCGSRDLDITRGQELDIAYVRGETETS